MPEGENFVPGALESSGELGVSPPSREWNAAARLRYLGPHPLIEDNSVARCADHAGQRAAGLDPAERGLLQGWEFHAEVLNVLDSDDDDIDYFYETRFPGEPPDGVLGRNSRVVEPRQLRVGMTKRF